MSEGWLPSGPIRIGVTAGASTPNSETGRTIARLLSFRGVSREAIDRWSHEGSLMRVEAEARTSEGA